MTAHGVPDILGLCTKANALLNGALSREPEAVGFLAHDGVRLGSCLDHGLRVQHGRIVPAWDTRPVKKRKRPRDPNQLAKLIVDVVTGEHGNDSPPQAEPEEAARRRKDGREKAKKAAAAIVRGIRLIS
jgi:hypothetical protein